MDEVLVQGYLKAFDRSNPNASRPKIEFKDGKYWIYGLSLSREELGEARDRLNRRANRIKPKRKSEGGA